MFLSYYLNLDSTNRFMSANIISIYLHLRLTISNPPPCGLGSDPLHVEKIVLLCF